MNQIFIRTRNQLLFSFASITLVGVAIAIISIYYFLKMDRIYKVTSSIQTVFNEYLKTMKSEHEFLTYETINPAFFRSGKSNFLDNHEKFYKNTKDALAVLKSREAYEDFEIQEEIKKITKDLEDYKIFFNITVQKVKKKGFKDYGVEGRMRYYIHDLERKSAIFGLGVEDVLMMRRHEKDFLLRNDISYIKKLSLKVDEFKGKINSKPHLSLADKRLLISLLDRYYKSFRELVTIGYQLGMKDDKGLNHELNMTRRQIEFHLHLLHEKAKISEENLIYNLHSSFVIVIVNLILISMFMIYMFSRPEEEEEDEDEDEVSRYKKELI